ncbi:histidine phosphatase family protein [Paenibacillus sp.]|uniref:histidine phosphatase family protein n=1 Tax=Paenibacillus sp. TaxID=58172 RepID=UPI0028AF7C5F|nr:histidine phosphatase family protein [Paenibacillus sp.]
MDLDWGLRLDMAIFPVEIELVLVRHGQTKWNVEHRYLGHTDLPLLPSAEEQLSKLQQLGRMFEKSENDKQEVGKQGCENYETRRAEVSDGFWRVFCSDLLRCRETLAYMAPSLEKVTVYDQRLREMNFGAWDGCTYEQLKDNSLYRSWIDDPSKITPPEGESWTQFDERLRSFLLDLGQAAETAIGHCAVMKNKGEVITNRALVVTHGGVIRNLLAQVVPDVTFYNAVAPSPGTAMVLKLRWQNRQWSATTSDVLGI